MSAPASPSNAAVSTPQSSFQYNEEQGSITLSNGKEYAISHLRLHGQDLIGGSANRNSNIKTLSQEQRKALFDMLEAIVADEKLNAELKEKEFDSVNFTFNKDGNDDDDAISVTVIGRVQSAANSVFNATVKAESIQKFHEALCRVFPKPPKMEEPEPKEIDEKHSVDNAAKAKKKNSATVTQKTPIIEEVAESDDENGFTEKP